MEMYWIVLTVYYIRIESLYLYGDVYYTRIELLNCALLYGDILYCALLCVEMYWIVLLYESNMPGRE